MSTIAAFSALTLLVSLVFTGLAVGAALAGYLNACRYAGPALAQSREVKWLRAGFICAGVTWALAFLTTLWTMLPQVLTTAGGLSPTWMGTPLLTVMVRVPEVLGIVAAVLVVIGYCGLLRRASAGLSAPPGVPPQV